MSELRLEPYAAQAARWPASGRHVLAQFDDDRVVVYQAYRPSIGGFAAEHGYFGGELSLSRMSWIKPDAVSSSEIGGKPDARRAVQLGLRGDTLARYAKEWVRRIEDITPIVREQHARMQSGGWDALHTPCEHVYPTP